MGILSSIKEWWRNRGRSRLSPEDAILGERKIEADLQYGRITSEEAKVRLEDLRQRYREDMDYVWGDFMRMNRYMRANPMKGSGYTAPRPRDP